MLCHSVSCNGIACLRVCLFYVFVFEVRSLMVDWEQLFEGEGWDFIAPADSKRLQMTYSCWESAGASDESRLLIFPVLLTQVSQTFWSQSLLILTWATLVLLRIWTASHLDRNMWAWVVMSNTSGTKGVPDISPFLSTLPAGWVRHLSSKEYFMLCYEYFYLSKETEHSGFRM